MSPASNLLAGALRSLRQAGLVLAVIGIATVGVASAPVHRAHATPALQLADHSTHHTGGPRF